MRPIRQTRSLAAADPNGIFLDQQIGGAGNLTLNGAFVTDGVAQFDAQRHVELESAGNLSAINFTITGTDEQGRAISETIAGPNIGVVSTVLDFFTVTQVAVDGAVGTDVEGGTDGVGASIPVPLDQYLNPFQVTLDAIVTGTIDGTVQFTADDIWSGVGPFNWQDHSGMTNFTADDTDSLIAPVTAVRLLTNSGTGSIDFAVVQAGVQ